LDTDWSVILFSLIKSTLTKARQALKQHWPNSVRRKQKRLAQAAAREQAEALQAEEALKRQGRCAQDVSLLRHKWEAAPFETTFG